MPLRLAAIHTGVSPPNPGAKPGRLSSALPPRAKKVTRIAFPGLSQSNERTALVEGDTQYSYRQANARIDRFAAGLLNTKMDLEEERIAVLIPAGLDYVTALHGIWRAGGIAIPLNVAAAEPELEHYLANAGVTRVITSHKDRVAVSRLAWNKPGNEGVPALDEGRMPSFPTCSLRASAAASAANTPSLPAAHQRRGNPRRMPNIDVLQVESLLADEPGELPAIETSRRAMIVFTSGTTGKPKGVVVTHKAIHAQIVSLIEAWQWSETDVIPLFLPLHHMHGIINVLSCALWCGATVHAMPKLDLARLCDQVARGTYSVFMAVPTIYVKLAGYFEQLEAAERKAVCAGFSRMRLNVSGSAACPVKVFKKWRELTGQMLLERYGTTETGMAISNPFCGERRAGHVGQALPGVNVQLFDEDDERITGDGKQGEIRIKGDGVFKEYWGNKAATRESFRDGWFCTGDIAVIEGGSYRIMGRSSVDIIKSGGYKLSALEIEDVLLNHRDICEVAVVGVPDDTWGESVTAFVTVHEGANFDFAGLKKWCAGKMSAYKIPKRLKILDSLPRNSMGKVIKTALRALP